MLKATEKMSKARAGLILDQPFFGSLALRLKLVEDATDNPTACVDGKTIKYNPEFIDGLTLDEVKGLVCHEVMHCSNQHHVRRDGRDMRKWNKACDYAINQLIVGCGLTLPKGGLLDRQYSDMSAEQIFGRLADEPEDENGNDPGACGGVSDAPGDSESDKSQAEQEWKVAVAQAAQQARAMGSMPGVLDRTIADLLEPVLDWKDLLRRFVDTAAKSDYSWCPPNRRYVHQGIYLPSMRSQELKNVVLVLDTSGSITASDLTDFGTEVKALVEDYQANALVVYCDDRVRNVERFDSGEPVVLHAEGGGGTDFKPPFEYVDNEGISPACLIYQTDGECNSFPADPGYPVLWVLTRKGNRFNPPFGDTVYL